MGEKSKRVCSIEITDAAVQDIHVLENFLNRKDKHERLFGDSIYRWDKIEKKLRGKYVFTHEYMKKESAEPQ